MVLLQHLHGIDAAGVVFADHHDLAEAALANDLEDGKVLHAQLTRLDAVEPARDENFAGRLRVCGQHLAQWQPRLLDRRRCIVGL